MSSSGSAYQSNKNQMGITAQALSTSLGLGAGDDLQAQMEEEVNARKKLQMSQPGFKNQQGISAGAVNPNTAGLNPAVQALLGNTGPM